MIENLPRSFTPTRLWNLVCLLFLIATGVAAGPTTAQFERVDTCPRCSSPRSAGENFDGVTPPTLPVGWLATNALGPQPLWVTSDSGAPDPPANSLPNAAFIDDPAVVSYKRLDWQFTFFAPGCCGQLTFRHNFNLE